MKVLHVSSEQPGYKSGGQLVVRESVEALSNVAEVDYLGPEIENLDVLKKINKTFFIKESSKLKNLFGILTLNFSSFYSSFRSMRKNIDIKSYDYIYVEFTKWLFIFKYAKKNGVKTIVRVHNIERDYSYNMYRLNKTLKGYLSYLYYSYIEKKIINMSDSIIVLTRKDKEYILKNFNNINEENITVMPVCLSEKQITLKNFDNSNINLLITGSLWYGPNYEGVIWFINNVWSKVRNYCNLYIAGSRPTDKLKEIVGNDSRINLIENPEDMEPIFNLADVYISPIFSGAGMKVKNAEAMSYGLPIVGSEHSFIGYEEVTHIHDVVNNEEDFIAAIEKFKVYTDDEMKKLRLKVLGSFKEKYSYSSADEYVKFMNI